MSVAITTVCLDCDIDAPEIGDGDEVGFPSLVTEREKHYSQRAFGYIYTGFLSVGILPRELDDYLVFLKDHYGHQLAVYADADLPDDVDEDIVAEYEEEVQKRLAERPPDTLPGRPQATSTTTSRSSRRSAGSVTHASEQNRSKR